MSPLWAAFFGAFSKTRTPKPQRRVCRCRGDRTKVQTFPEEGQTALKENTRLTVQTSLSKEYTLILMYKTSKQEMKHGNKIYVLFCSATCLEAAYNKSQSSLFCSVLFCWGSWHALGVRCRIHGGPVFNACDSGGNAAGATPTRLFVDLNKLHSSVRRRGPAVDAGSRCQNDLVASDKGQDGGTPRAPLNPQMLQICPDSGCTETNGRPACR